MLIVVVITSGSSKNQGAVIYSKTVGTATTLLYAAPMSILWYVLLYFPLRGHCLRQAITTRK